MPKMIDLIVGAMPNFMKISAVIRAMEANRAAGNPVPDYRLIHTGQHYDTNMSGSFFEQHFAGNRNRTRQLVKSVAGVSKKGGDIAMTTAEKPKQEGMQKGIVVPVAF